MNAETITNRITARLEALGLSARKASMQAGLGPDGIRTIQNGHNPGVAKLKALAEVLDCSLGHLIGSDEEPPPRPSSPGALLRQARRAAGLSAEELGQRVGLTASAVRNHENGTNGIKPVTAAAYAQELGQDLKAEHFLYGGGVWDVRGGVSVAEAKRASGTAPYSLEAVGTDWSRTRLRMDVELPLDVALDILNRVKAAEGEG